MKIMLIDRDRTVIDDVTSAYEGVEGVELAVHTTKNAALEQLANETFDAVFIDPAPQNDELRTFVIQARRKHKCYLPIVALSHLLKDVEALKAGANDFLPKPITADAFKEKADNAIRLSGFCRQLNSEGSEFPSGDGIISKVAFLQIFSSFLERADRYGEETFLCMTTINNIDDIRAEKGDEVADHICNNLKEYTMRIRRMSDIAARTATNQICLMLIRPYNEDEPKMAVERFADSMGEFAELISDGKAEAVINVSMMRVPSGKIMFSQDFE